MKNYSIVGKYNKIAEYAFYLFYLGIIWELVVMMTDHLSSWTIPYRGRITHVAFILFCIKTAFTKYSKNEYILILLLGVIGVISYFTCGDEYVIRCVALIAASKGVDIKKLLRVILSIAMAGTIAIVIASILGVAGKIVDIRDYGRGMEEARYCFGFNHANNVHDMFWYIVGITMMIFRERLTISFYLMVLLANMILFHFTASRTGFIVLILLAVGGIVVKYIKEEWANILLYFGNIMTSIFLFGLTIYASKNNIFMSALVRKLDPLLNGRLEMLSEHANMSLDGWLFFSNGRSSEYIDNGFSVLLYSYGVAIGLLAIIVILVVTSLLFKKRAICEQIVLLSAVLVFFMESTYMLNVSLLCNVILIIYMVSINNIEND